MDIKKRPNPNHPMDHHAARGFDLFDNAAAADRAVDDFRKKLDTKFPLKAKSTSLRRLLSIAASIVLVLGLAGGYLFTDQAKKSSWATDSNWQVAPDMPLATTVLAPNRDHGEVAQDKLEAATAAYLNQAYKTAALDFRSYLNLEQKPRPETYLYLGHAELQYDPAKAIFTLKSFLRDAQLDQYYRDLAQWYLAWAYIRTGDKDKAEQSLKQITDPASPIMPDAQELLLLLSEGAVDLGN